MSRSSRQRPLRRTREALPRLDTAARTLVRAQAASVAQLLRDLERDRSAGAVRLAEVRAMLHDAVGEGVR